MTSQEEKCAREVANWAKLEFKDRFDKKQFDPKQFLDKMHNYSPKMVELFNTIEELDKNDMKKFGKLHKHFIFSDIKRGFGAKILTSAFIAKGYNLVLKKQGSRIVIDENVVNNNSTDNFAVLSSTAFWDNPFTLNTVRDIISLFNKRNSNIYGSKIRFIILDSAFKEGIDLFDVKYGHIFEEQRTDADLTQAVGRMTRNCGQQGLPFVKNEGWKIYLYYYKLFKINRFNFISNKQTILQHLYSKNKDIQYNVNFQNSLLKAVKEFSVDRDLNNVVSKHTNSTIWKTVLVVGGVLSGLTALGAGGYYAYNRYNKTPEISTTPLLLEQKLESPFINNPNLKLTPILNALFTMSELESLNLNTPDLTWGAESK